MKPIPKELQAYFPTKVHPDRPWWLYRWRDEGMATVFTFERPDGYGTDLLSDREEIDKANPMQPPPVLVGQVWAGVGDDGMVAFEVLTVATAEDKGDAVYAWGVGVAMSIADLIERGYLLRCPFGYAPWSGPEVT